MSFVDFVIDVRLLKRFYANLARILVISCAPDCYSARQQVDNFTWWLSQPFYMRLCHGVHKKNHHFVIKDIMVVMNRLLLLGNTICDTSFCDAITNIYDKTVLKIFINTIAKSHVKKLTGWG